ncbi:hypothetical protein ACNQKP_03490 [Bdellovibrio bacteriovorus]|uniref:hypothetical protein n=1 Tax=Bdellovibrio bacteriovorus TaxID=959 RepID=UPI003AA7AC1D
MPETTYGKQLRESITAFLSHYPAEFEKYIPSKFVWNELSISDLISNIKYLRKRFEDLRDSSFEQDFPYNLVQGLTGNLNNLNSYLAHFKSSGDQNSFNNAISTSETIRSLLITNGFSNYLDLDQNSIEKKSNRIQEQSSELQKSIEEVEDIKRNLTELTKVATSGAIAVSFSKRSEEIRKTRLFWMYAAIFLILVSCGMGMHIANVVQEMSTIENAHTSASSGSSGLNSTKADRGSTTVVSLETDYAEGLFVLMLRIIALGPLVYGLVFCIIQYSRERGLEEEYAHRAAISSILPTYSTLISESSVKDNIMSTASAVIFTLPESADKKNQKFGAFMKEAKQIAELVKVVRGGDLGKPN